MAFFVKDVSFSWGRRGMGSPSRMCSLGFLPSWINTIKRSGFFSGGEVDFLYSSVQCRCSCGHAVSDSLCGHLFNDETIMCCTAHSGILVSNSLPLAPRNMNNDAFTKEVEMLPETQHRGRTCCWLMPWIVLGIRERNWLELLLTSRLKSKAFLSSSDKVPTSVWLPLEPCPSV